MKEISAEFHLSFLHILLAVRGFSTIINLRCSDLLAPVNIMVSVFNIIKKKSPCC